jgi:hypothetical protein
LVDAAFAFQLCVVDDPVLADVAVQIIEAEHGVGIGCALEILAGLDRLGDFCLDIVGRFGGARGQDAAKHEQRGKSPSGGRRRDAGGQDSLRAGLAELGRTLAPRAARA